MRGSIVFTFVAVCLGSLWFSPPSRQREVVGIRPDGSPFYASTLSSPSAAVTSAPAGRVHHSRP